MFASLCVTLSARFDVVALTRVHSCNQLKCTVQNTVCLPLSVYICTCTVGLCMCPQDYTEDCTESAIITFLTLKDATRNELYMTSLFFFFFSITPFTSSSLLPLTVCYSNSPFSPLQLRPDRSRATLLSSPKLRLAY